MLKKLNFPDSLVDLIMQCVMTVRFRILINGELSICFSPSRGLGQGDPLSPYLLTLCAKGFSSLISSHSRNLAWYINGKDAHLLSHLFFADDCLLFMQDTQDSPHVLHYVIHKYE